jgi:hypothetical protein
MGDRRRQLDIAGAGAADLDVAAQRVVEEVAPLPCPENSCGTSLWRRMTLSSSIL